MKALFNRLVKSSEHAFTISEATAYHALNDFHYHPELELIYIIEGEGVLLIGDNFEQVNRDTMILVGCNVPHMFKFDTYAYQHSLMKQGKVQIPLKLLTLHFNPEILGESFMMLDENSLINDLLQQALKGILIYGDDKKTAIDLMYKITASPKYEHILLLMQLLTMLALSNNRSFITVPTDKNVYNKTDETRLTKIYLYTLNNFSRVIKLKEVADIVHMVPNAFCRYFKLRTNKSYFSFLMDVRITHACKLLKEKDYSIVVVCYESGFTNLSNFNRHFKLATGKTPLEYRKGFQGG